MKKFIQRRFGDKNKNCKEKKRIGENIYDKKEQMQIVKFKILT